jgi:glc operon protein GlcG
MYTRESLGLEEGRAVIDAIIQEASKTPDRPVAAAVVDDQGELICYARMDGCVPFNHVMAVRKAYTVTQVGIDTLNLGKGLEMVNTKFTDFGVTELTTVQGGLPVIRRGSGTRLGGIGVSGRMAHEDEELARAGLNALKM